MSACKIMAGVSLPGYGEVYFPSAAQYDSWTRAYLKHGQSDDELKASNNGPEQCLCISGQTGDRTRVLCT